MVSGIMDPLQALAGQPHVTARLDAMASSPPQSIVLEGGTSDQRLAAALYWAMRLNCSSANKPCGSCKECRQIRDFAFNDLLIFDGREGTIKIQSIRDTRPIWGQPPNGDGYRVSIFIDAQTFMSESANALLKTLEEPRPGNVFVLLSPQRERLLNTLVSRSWVVTLAWPETAELTSETQQWVQAALSFWESGRGWFERTSQKGAVDKHVGLDVVVGLQSVLRRAMSDPSTDRNASRLASRFGLQGMRRLHLVLGEAQDALNTQTPVNPSLVLDWLVTRMV